jgi:hypothetical protein
MRLRKECEQSRGVGHHGKRGWVGRGRAARLSVVALRGRGDAIRYHLDRSFIGVESIASLSALGFELWRLVKKGEGVVVTLNSVTMLACR